MNSTSGYAKEQYAFVQGSRTVLFDYCKTISPQDLINEDNSFANGASMRNLLVHIVTTYEYWIANVALKKNIPYSKHNEHKNIDDVMKLFNAVDTFTQEFIAGLENAESEIEYQTNGVKNTVKPFKLFSHVITHEYHHKGQILTLSRHLGYTPVDTDIMR